MAFRRSSSSRQYRDYRRELRAKRGNQEPSNGSPLAEWGHGASRPKSTKRSRTFTRLFIEFWGLLAGHRRVLIAALLTLSLSTVLGLVPLYGTKLVFDTVLGGKP